MSAVVLTEPINFPDCSETATFSNASLAPSGLVDREERLAPSYAQVVPNAKLHQFLLVQKF
jgi:hypothetical protein